MLAPGVKVKNAAGAEVIYGGGAIQMKQLVVPYRFQTNIRWSDGEPLKQADIELARQHDCQPAADMYMQGTCDTFAGVITTNTAYTITYKPGYQGNLYFLPPYTFYPAHQVITTPHHTGKTLAQVPPGDSFRPRRVHRAPVGRRPLSSERMDSTASAWCWNATRSTGAGRGP